MSKYAELLGLLKEDIDQMVEKRLEERLGSIVEVLMPSILEHVANSVQIYSGSTPGNYEPSLESKQITIQTQPGHTRYLSAPFTTVNKNYYEIKWNNVDEEFRKLQNRISLLEHPNP